MGRENTSALQVHYCLVRAEQRIASVERVIARS